MVQEKDVRKLLQALKQPEGFAQLLWKRMEEDYVKYLTEHNWVNPGIVGVPSSIALSILKDIMGITLEGLKKAVDASKEEKAHGV